MSLSKEEKEQALKRSQKLADEFDIERAARFSQGHQDKEWYDDFVTLFNMITDLDFSKSAGTWATIAGALAYVVFPVDIIPDLIPYIGWLDDVFVLGWAMKAVSQAYCSALPVAYSHLSSELWFEFAKIILEASYEATICAGIKLS